MPAPTVLVVQHQAGAGPGLLAPALAARGLAADVWRVEQGRALPGVAALAGLVVLGGDMDAVDGAGFPHLLTVRERIREAAEAGLPVLGLCLGAQLAALALGGAVARRPDGVCLGWRAARPVGGDAVTAGLEPGARLFHWHRDGFTPPPGATRILDDCGAFRLGSVRALQAHPEASTAILAGWTQEPGAAGELARARVDVAGLLAAAPARERHGRAVLGAWAAEVAAGAAARAARSRPSRAPAELP